MSAGDNVSHIAGDGEIGKTAAMLKTDLEGVLDSYAGSINNAEALGALVLQMLDTYMDAREDQLGEQI